MAQKKEESQVRYQIPVHSEVYDELERLAEGFDRPISWMVRELIIDGVESQEDLLAYLMFRVVGKALGSKREKKLKRTLPDSEDGEIVRVQVNLPESLSNKVEKLARAHFRSPSNMSAMLVHWTLDDEAWMMKFIQSKYSAPIRAIIKPGREPKIANKKLTQRRTKVA